MHRIFLLSILVAGYAAAFAQDTIYFDKALTVNAPVRYGREALYMDELAYQLYNGSLKTPAENALFGNDDKGQPITWKSITADSIHRLRPAGGGGFGMRGRGPTYMYLTYNSPVAQVMLINIRGNAGFFLNGEAHMGDPYSSGWMYVPVQLKKGLNELYVRGTFITASLHKPVSALQLETTDATLPSLIPGATGRLQAAVVVFNNTAKDCNDASIVSKLNNKTVTTRLPVIPAMSMRKVSFEIETNEINDASNVCNLVLTKSSKITDTGSVKLDIPRAGEPYSSTFTSEIDGSLQYYAVNPQSGNDPKKGALFLSVHGAGVEAIGQARAYKAKDWGTLVAATNRRPRGFNWEDWGRLDALEVFELAKNKFKPDPWHIYLTGHSMGGHGTWFLGATYPDKWAAIAPCAGYPTLKGYGSADGLIPDSSADVKEQMLIRASNQSDVIKLATNYKPLGVYVFHGDADRTVSVNYARQMKKVLAEFHNDHSYYEYPGGEHWFGDQSVDWKPLFDFFKWHELPADSTISEIDFTTASPGISSSKNWAAILQQEHSLEYSRVQLKRNLQNATLTGSTQNVHVLSLALGTFKKGETVKITLDSLSTLEHQVASFVDTLFLEKQNGTWAKSKALSANQKNPARYGTFKDAFNHRMIFVYGTKGNKAENNWALTKARFDAETWYYRGNGAVDIISDKEFDQQKYAGRGVVLFGNATTNSVYNTLLNDCPIRIERNKITSGNNTWTGDNLAGYFVWPLKNSPLTSVAVIGGTGLKGMNAANANQYFAGASGFPDYMIYSLEMLHKGTSELKAVGFFNNEWGLPPEL
ncbi:MAG: alpha/beta hydrolase-fold protein [Flavitalea sp.]